MSTKSFIRFFSGTGVLQLLIGSSLGILFQFVATAQQTATIQGTGLGYKFFYVFNYLSFKWNLMNDAKACPIVWRVSGGFKGVPNLDEWVQPCDATEALEKVGLVATPLQSNLSVSVADAEVGMAEVEDDAERNFVVGVSGNRNFYRRKRVKFRT